MKGFYFLGKAIILLSLLTVALTGCFSSDPRDIEAFTMPYMVEVSSKNYVLGPPDDIVVHCSKVPEIDLQTQQIRPDGRISFEGIGELKAGKISEEQLEEISCHACPGPGSCSGMFTANSMNCLNEALGMALPGNGTVVATHLNRTRLFERAAERIVEMAEDDLFGQGYKAIYLGIGAHKGRQLRADGEDAEGGDREMGAGQRLADRDAGAVEHGFKAGRQPARPSRPRCRRRTRPARPRA